MGQAVTGLAPREILAALFHRAVAAADPAHGIAAHLPPRPKGRTLVVGAGKAAARMAQALEAAWDGPLEGLCVTRYGHGAPTRFIEIAEAAHPVPDSAGEAGARRLLAMLEGLCADDLVIALISGGGSALLPVPPPGLTLADEQALNEALLSSGMPIHDMNCVRKHFSLVKGGRLAAAAHPARVVTFVVSDIPGDNPALVASGPTLADARGQAEALAALARHDVRLSPRAQSWITSAQARAPMPDDARFARNEVHLIASAGLSLAAAAQAARDFGLATHVLSDAVEGEAHVAGARHGALAMRAKGPCVLLSGGETTVTIHGAHGRGGRNSEFMLGLALEIAGQSHIHALAADTDGMDGSGDNAGAYADGGSLARMKARGVDAVSLLQAHDSWQAFASLDDLFITGPTRTNVNDFRAVLITSPA
jgi:glycerate 2-kinase